jgi:cardiolipin synthase
MQAMFNQDIAESERIDAAAWARRPILLRLKEWGASLIQRWL